jgi:hypothetical protein
MHMNTFILAHRQALSGYISHSLQMPCPGPPANYSDVCMSVCARVPVSEWVCVCVCVCVKERVCMHTVLHLSFASNALSRAACKLFRCMYVFGHACIYICVCMCVCNINLIRFKFLVIHVCMCVCNISHLLQISRQSVYAYSTTSLICSKFLVQGRLHIVHIICIHSNT